MLSPNRAFQRTALLRSDVAENQGYEKTEKNIMENFGRLNATLSAFRMVPPSQLDAYLIVARELLQGVEVLSGFNNINPRSCALIAAHSLGCMLKAFLCHKGKIEELRKPKVRHDLLALWDLSYNEDDLCIPKSPPDWVKVLSLGHGPDYYFRYQEGKNKVVVNVGSFPELVPMEMALREIFEKVNTVIKAK